MHLRLTYPAPLLILTLLGPACVIDPGVLEGESDTAGDELGDASDASSTGDDASDASDTEGGGDETSDTPIGSECEQGTNPQGGFEPLEFPLGQCPTFSCAEGWGHDAPPLPIAWTRQFARDADENAYVPAGLVVRGDELLVVGSHDDASEILRLSSEGELIATHPIDTPLGVYGAAAGPQGPLFLAAYDPDTSEGLLLATTPLGEPLWSHPGRVKELQPLPGGGVVVVHYDDGQATMTKLSAAGEVEWTTPTLFGGAHTLAPSGRIVSTGKHDIDEPGQFIQIRLADGSLVEELPMPADVTDPPHGVAMIDDTHMLGIASRYTMLPEYADIDATIARIDFAGPSLAWSEAYDRATHNCWDGQDAPWSEPTYDWFDAIVRLPDGTFLIRGSEEAPGMYMFDGRQPRVIHLDAEGEVLAGDRGLWLGEASGLTLGNDGSVYALLTYGDTQPSLVHNGGFYVRKYLP